MNIWFLLIAFILLIVLYAVLKVDKVNKISIDKENIIVNETVENNLDPKFIYIVKKEVDKYV